MGWICTSRNTPGPRQPSAALAGCVISAWRSLFLQEALPDSSQDGMRFFLWAPWPLITALCRCQVTVVLPAQHVPLGGDKFMEQIAGSKVASWCYPVLGPVPIALRCSGWSGVLTPKLLLHPEFHEASSSVWGGRVASEIQH